MCLQRRSRGRSVRGHAVRCEVYLLLEECAPVPRFRCYVHWTCILTVDYCQFPVGDAMLTDTALMCSIIIIIIEGPFGGDDY